MEYLERSRDLSVGLEEGKRKISLTLNKRSGRAVTSM